MSIVRTIIGLIILYIVIVYFPQLIWLGIILFIGLVVFNLITMNKAVKIREEIEKDPEAYFEKQREEKIKQDPNIIEAEFKEKVEEKEKV